MGHCSQTQNQAKGHKWKAATQRDTFFYFPSFPSVLFILYFNFFVSLIYFKIITRPYTTEKRKDRLNRRDRHKHGINGRSVLVLFPLNSVQGPIFNSKLIQTFNESWNYPWVLCIFIVRSHQFKWICIGNYEHFCKNLLKKYIF